MMLCGRYTSLSYLLVGFHWIVQRAGPLPLEYVPKLRMRISDIRQVVQKLRKRLPNSVRIFLSSKFRPIEYNNNYANR